MNIFEIDKNKPVPKLELSLHKPNEEQVGSLTDAYDRNGDFSYGQYNELTMTVPKFVEREHKQIPYKEFDLIRDKYLVKATYGELFSEFLVVTKIHKSKNDGMPTKQVTLRSRQYELNNKTLRELRALSYTPEEIFTLSLENTNWTIGHIDEEFNTPNSEGLRPRRSFEETKITTLNLLYKIAETFGGILQFDTFNRVVNMYKPENAEIDMGLSASYGKYIKSLDEDIDAESTVTRLFIYGKDNISINEVNPTGQSYLEDFSFYMHGYETDDNGNVISSSPYMSDGLCQAIIDYNLLLIEKEGYFKNYLDEIEPIQETLTTRLSELYVLESDFAIIQDSLDIAKMQKRPDDYIDEEYIQELETQKVAKQTQINNKNAQINELETQIQIIYNDIEDLRILLSLEENFTSEQIVERNDFVTYGEWSDDNYFDVNELYEKGKEVMKKMREPKRDLDLSLVQFLRTVESQRDWNRIGLGYVIMTDYEPLDIEFKALITQMKIGFDSDDMSIAISNVDYKSNKKQFLEMLYGTAVSTADRVQNKANEWTNNIDKTDYLAEFLENPWETSRQRIIAGINETVDISRRGIIINNPEFPNERLHATSGVLALSLDGGQTFSTAISPYGVIAERLIGKAILGEKLSIGDEEGTFDITGNLLTIKDRNEIVRLRLGEYTANKFGLQLMNKTGQDVVLDENGILQTWQISEGDNVDMTHGLRLYVYLPSDILSIRQARLNFRILPFRSYSGTTEAGGGSVQTSASGGGTSTSTESGGSSTQTSNSGGGVSKSTNSGGSSSQTSSAGGNHTHLMFSIVGYDSDDSPNTSAIAGASNEMGATLRLPGNNASGQFRTQGASGDHVHGISIPSHDHSFSTPNHSHTISIPSHQHNVTIPNHQHNVTIPTHRHDIAHGIFVSTFASGVGIIINGIDRTTQLGGKFNSSQANIEIKDYLEVDQWNEIELTSDSLGRIDSNLFLQSFLAT